MSWALLLSLCWDLFFSSSSPITTILITFWPPVQKNFATPSLFSPPWEKRSEVSDTPTHTAHLLGAVIHTTAASHLYASLSLVGLAFSHLLSLLLSVLPRFPFQDSIYEGSKLTKALFFCYWSGSFGVGPRASAGTGGAPQYISHSFH